MVQHLSRSPELVTPAAHSDAVTAVTLSGDGRLAISASVDETLKVWEVRSGRELHTLAGHALVVDAVAVTPDGQYAISALGNSFEDSGKLKVWELSSGRERRTLTRHAGGVAPIAVTPDGRRVISASFDQTMTIWDLGSGRELCSLTGHAGPVTDVSVTPDGQRAVSASEDQTLKAWDLETGTVLATFTRDSAAYCSMVSRSCWLATPAAPSISSGSRTENRASNLVFRGIPVRNGVRGRRASLSLELSLPGATTGSGHCSTSSPRLAQLPQ